MTALILKRLTVLVVALAAMLPLGAFASFQDGVEAFRAKDYDRAVAAWQPLADADHPSALFNLAQMYRRGLGVVKSFETAEQYYRRAALLGHVAAQSNLGALYYTMEPTRPKEAIYFWRLAARQGDPASQFQLAARYFNGEHLVRDPVLAYAWMTLAASSGLEEAKHALQTMHGYMSAEEINRGSSLAASMRGDIGRDNTSAESNVVSIPLAPSTPQPGPPAPAPASEPAPVAAATPAPDPTPSQTAPVASMARPAPPPATPPAAASAAPSDVWRVQIAARRSQDSAQEAIDKLSREHGDVLDGTEFFVQRADLGDRGIFYRVQIGRFEQRSAANALCADLSARGTECFVTRRPAN